jgi:hypothetical protein
MIEKNKNKVEETLQSPQPTAHFWNFTRKQIWHAQNVEIFFMSNVVNPKENNAIYV